MGSEEELLVLVSVVVSRKDAEAERKGAKVIFTLRLFFGFASLREILSRTLDSHS